MVVVLQEIAKRTARAARARARRGPEECGAYGGARDCCGSASPAPASCCIIWRTAARATKDAGGQGSGRAQGQDPHHPHQGHLHGRSSRGQVLPDQAVRRPTHVVPGRSSPGQPPPPAVPDSAGCCNEHGPCLGKRSPHQRSRDARQRWLDAQRSPRTCCCQSASPAGSALQHHVVPVCARVPDQSAGTARTSLCRSTSPPLAWTTASSRCGWATTRCARSLVPFPLVAYPWGAQRWCVGSVQGTHSAAEAPHLVPTW